MEQAPDASEEVLQLEGGPGPDPVQYQGPLFPPQPPPSALASAQGQSLDLGLSIHREALEERLVQWVEQQLMSRFICEMSRPPPTDPTRTCYDYQSEPEERPEPAHRLSPIQSEHNIASDLNHGDSSLQLQVESGLNLDSDQVRGLVLEVLTEIVALFLGSRESQEPETGSRTKPGSELGGELEETEPNRVETPEVATPEPTPVHTPPPALQTPPLSPVATPTPTPPLLSDWPNANENLPPEPVATPPLTPPVTCPNAESPLAERQEESDKPRIPTPPVFAPPPDSTPAPVSSPPPPEPPTPPNASSSPSSSPSSPSFSSPGATHSAPRHISEGELLLSLRHLQAIHEDGCSFSSSLHELQEMDPDPPSEGQIHSSSILLSFITKMQQREPRPQPEGSGFLEEEEEVSAGEIQDELIKDVTNQERSPGQASPITGDVLEWTNQSALSEGVLTSDLLDSHLLQTSAPVCTPKPNADLELDQGQDAPKNQDPPKNQETLKTLDQNQNQSQDQTKDQTKDQSRDPETLQRSSQEREGGVWGAGGAGGGVWEEGGPGVLTVDVFVPSPDEGAVASDSSSDVF
ncbi:hypothetical protein NQD34_016587 [Periophthalmus magnuspinnatus]|nr:hypothetical protein NQD34_016587 [Periophthalmus magnuspinnatus]